MPPIRVRTQNAAFGSIVAYYLNARGHPTHVLHDSGVTRNHVRRAATIDDARLDDLLALLDPLDLPLTADPPADADIEIGLCNPEDIGTIGVTLQTNNPALGRALRQTLSEAGVEVHAILGDSTLDESTLDNSEASAAVRQFLRFVCRTHAVPFVAETNKSGRARGLTLKVYDPVFAERPVRERHGVSLETDDLTAAGPLRARLEEAGYRTRLVPRPATGRPRFLYDRCGWIADGPEAEAVLAIAGQWLQEHAVAGASWSLRPIASHGEWARQNDITPLDPGHELDMHLNLPIAAARNAASRDTPNAGPAAWRVTVQTDDAMAVAPLVERIVALGFPTPRIHVEDIPWMAPRVTSRMLDTAPRLAAKLTDLVGAFASQTAGRATHVERRNITIRDDEVLVHAFTSGHRDGARVQRLASERGRWRVRLRGSDAAVHAALTAAGFQVGPLEPYASPSGAFYVHFGGAPDAILDELEATIRPFLKPDAPQMTRRCKWHTEDKDCWISLDPTWLAAPSAAIAIDNAPRDVQSFVHATVSSETSPFLVLTENHVDIAGIRLPRRPTQSPRTPAASFAAAYVFDTATATLLRSLAIAVRLGEPVGLEGCSGASKTSAVLALASLVRAPVWRVNLHGRTDPTDLLGTYVPDAGGSRTFRWRDGPVLEAAVANGAFLLLDEANLAEPSCIEALNPLLERDRTLVHPDTGAPVPVDAGLRLFATGNVGYAGRAAQSPAWRNRIRAWHLVEEPSESDLRTSLRALVLGDPPEVLVHGRRWTCPVPESPWRGLASARGIEAFVDALARFHVSASAALAAQRDRTTVLTRRDLWSVLDFLMMIAEEVGVSKLREAHYREALARYYVASRPVSARGELLALLEATHLTRRAPATEAA